jgi:hypothetical protein
MHCDTVHNRYSAFSADAGPRRESGLCLPEKVDTGSDFLPGLVGEHHFSSVAYASMLRARE